MVKMFAGKREELEAGGVKGRGDNKKLNLFHKRALNSREKTHLSKESW